MKPHVELWGRTPGSDSDAGKSQLLIALGTAAAERGYRPSDHLGTRKDIAAR